MNKDLTLADLLQFIRKNIVVSIVTALIFSVITYFVSSSMAVTVYTYKLSYGIEVAWENVELSPSGALTAADFAKNQVTALKPRLKGTTLLKDVIKEAGYEKSLKPERLASMISISNEENVPILEISFTGTNPQALRRLAHTYSTLAPKHVRKSYCYIEAFEPVTYAGAFSTPVKSYTTSAFILGTLGILVLLYFIESLDTRVKSATEIEKKYEIPNLGVIPNFYINVKNSYSRYSYRKETTGNYES